MERFPNLSKCANPGCEASFLRMGEGSLTVFSVEEPGALGLPPDIHQKVVWLCARCAQHKYIQYDREHNRLRVLEVPQGPQHRGVLQCPRAPEATTLALRGSQ